MTKRSTRKIPGTPKRRSVTQPAKPPGKNVAPVLSQLPARARPTADARPVRMRSSRAAFEEIAALIETSRREAGRAVNVQLIELY